MEKLIITCCTNDAFYYDDSKLHMPMTVREVADSAREARDAGAAVVHVHPPQTAKFTGRGAFNEAEREAWVEIVQVIRQESDVIIEHGFGGMPYLLMEHHVPKYPLEVRKHPFDLAAEKPDMITVNIGHQHHAKKKSPPNQPEPNIRRALKFATDKELTGYPGLYSMPTQEEREDWMRQCRAAGVKPSIQTLHLGDKIIIERLAARGLIEPPYCMLFEIGGHGGLARPTSIDVLMNCAKNLPGQSVWSVFASSRGDNVDPRQQMAVQAWAITLGGHARVGMEDNPYYWKDVPARSNAQLVERVARLAREIGREIASPAEARQMLGLRPWKSLA